MDFYDEVTDYDRWEAQETDYDRWEDNQVFLDEVAERENERCTCRTYAVGSIGGDGYGSNYKDSSGCPIHDTDEARNDAIETTWGYPPDDQIVDWGERAIAQYLQEEPPDYDDEF